MHRLAFFAIGALVGAAALAQDLLECVDPDVLRGLIFPGNTEQVVSTAVPQEMSGIDVPGQFSWIGSAERNLGRVGRSPLTMVTAAYRTNLSPDAARALAVEALATGGWEVQAAQPSLGISVFTSESQPLSRAACRDGESVSLSANALDGRTYVLYGISRGGNTTACDQRMRPSVFTGTVIDEHLPTLKLPSDPVTGTAAQMGGAGGGGSGSERSMRVEFRLDDSLGNAAHHFARQMADQGWLSDANWSGSTTAGSSWSKQPDAVTTIKSTLHVTAVDDSQFMVILHIVEM